MKLKKNYLCNLAVCACASYFVAFSASANVSVSFMVNGQQRSLNFANNTEALNYMKASNFLADNPNYNQATDSLSIVANINGVNTTVDYNPTTQKVQVAVEGEVVGSFSGVTSLTDLRAATKQTITGKATSSNFTVDMIKSNVLTDIEKLVASRSSTSIHAGNPVSLMNTSFENQFDRSQSIANSTEDGVIISANGTSFSQGSSILNNQTISANYVKDLNQSFISKKVKWYAGGFVSHSYFGNSNNAAFISVNGGLAMPNVFEKNALSVSLVADLSTAYGASGGSDLAQESNSYSSSLFANINYKLNETATIFYRPYVSYYKTSSGIGGKYNVNIGLNDIIMKHSVGLSANDALNIGGYNIGKVSAAYTRTDVDNSSLFMSQFNSLDLSTSFKKYTAGLSYARYREINGNTHGMLQVKGSVAL